MGRLIDDDRVIESLFDYCNGKKTLGQCIDDTPTEEAIPKKVIKNFVDTIKIWIKTADDEYDREEMGRVNGLRQVVCELDKILNNY